jgi:hypothetical protein
LSQKQALFAPRTASISLRDQFRYDRERLKERPESSGCSKN